MRFAVGVDTNRGRPPWPVSTPATLLIINAINKIQTTSESYEKNISILIF